ncbi:MAG: PstS family phosphate ABC transporter substrate-binding protein [Planctomycetaceae bacterium]|jgi:phosphate transport system substrate-binding protein|nr:PstS family phosphate ABC transporter substrate-binding protein [Planctomycetaceae bacterium]
MTETPITKTESTTPKPFNTTGYLVKTTFWATFLPGMIVSTPVSLLACFSPVFFITIPIFTFCLFLFYCFNQFRKRFAKNLHAGNIPDDFFLRVLPFFLPLFYVLIHAAAAFHFAPISQDMLPIFIICSLPHYIGWTLISEIIIAIGGGWHEVILLLPFGLSFIISIIGTVYVSRIAPPPQHQSRGIGLISILLLFLCGMVCLTYSNFRTEILFDEWNEKQVIRDEGGNGHFDGDRTDLSEYEPFAPDNKLVKIDSPTLRIENDYPRIHGALALYPVYAAAVESIYCDSKIKNNEVALLVRGGTTPKAFKDLLERQCDMVFMLQPSEKQWTEAESKGIKLSVTPIGYEAFVFFVNKTNPVDQLTLEQIRNIYSKRMTRWSDVGGNNQKILPFQRPEGSGSQTMMIQVMGDTPIAKPQRAEFQIAMGGIINRVADYRNYNNSIGFSFRYYVEGMFKHDGVKLLRINGVEPTIENIQNGSYPLIGQLVIITIGNKNPNVLRLTDWFLSPQGQDLIRRVGYVPLQTESVVSTESVSEHQ